MVTDVLYISGYVGTAVCSPTQVPEVCMYRTPFWVVGNIKIELHHVLYYATDTAGILQYNTIQLLLTDQSDCSI